MASVKEQNAAYDVLHAEIIQLINDRAPSFFRGQILQAFESPEGKAKLVHMVKKGLEAAEKVREKENVGNDGTSH